MAYSIPKNDELYKNKYIKKYIYKLGLFYDKCTIEEDI